MLELSLSTWAGIIGMALEIELSVLVMRTSWRVLELVLRWTDSADVLGGCRTIKASPLVCGERKGVDRLYVGKKVCKVVILVAIEDGRGGGGTVHCCGRDRRVQVLRLNGIHREQHSDDHGRSDG